MSEWARLNVLGDSLNTTSHALAPLDIGGVRTSTNLVLSPMSGVTDCAFRRLVKSCSGDAVGLLVSEFIAAEGLTRDNRKTQAMLRYDESERPLSIQIFGADVDRMVRAAIMVEDIGADIVDINCGCPAPKVVKRGGGAQLMRTPDVLRDILRGIRSAVSIPMTVKVRSGWDADCMNAVDIAQLAQDEGASMLAVHGRTRIQLYRGDADWTLVEHLRSRLSIPVIGSGDVTLPSHALDRLSVADGVMIGRAAMGNPWIFAQTQALAEGRELLEPSPQERVAALARFRGYLDEALPERAFHGRFRGFACRMVKGLPGSAAARRRIGAAVNCGEVVDIFSDFILNAPAEVSGPDAAVAVG
jgi:tRNA-dihydrouridine synthase B